MAKSLYQIIVSLDGDEKVSKGLKEIGLSAGIATAALGAIVLKASEAAKEYDAALAKFNTIANETTGTINEQKKAFSDLTDAVKNGVTEAEALNAGYEVLSSGYSNLNDVIGILEVSQKAAIGGFSNLNTVVDATTTLLNVFGETYGEATTVTERANDILSQAIAVQNLGKITVDQYAQSIGILAPTARAAGVSLSELNGVIALTTSRGIKADTAIRGYRQLLVNLIRPTDDAKNAAKEFGIELGQQALTTNGYRETLQKIVDTAKENPAIVSRIFTDTDSLNIANVLSTSSELLDKFIKEAEIAAQKGVIETQFELVSESDVEKQKRLLNLINEALVDLGTGAVNSLEPLIEAVSTAVKAFKNAPPEIKQFVGGLALLLTGVGSLTTGLIGGTVALQQFQRALQATGLSVKSLALQAGVLTAAALVLQQTVSTFTAINDAASSTEQGIKSVDAALEELDAYLASEGTEGEKFDAINFSIQRTKESIEESLNPIDKFFDKVITGFNKVGSVVGGFIDKIPLIPKFVKEAIKDTLTLGLGDLIPRDDDGELVTRAEAAANKINVALNDALAKSASVRQRFSLVDFDTQDVEELRLTLASLSAQKDALNKIRYTDKEQFAEIEKEKKLLDELLAAANKAAEAKGLTVKSTIDTKEAVESQAEAEKRLNEELSKSVSLLQAKTSNQLKEIDILKARGEISSVEAIEQTLAVEESATRERIRLIQELIDSDKLGAEARAKAEADLAKAEIELASNTAERVAQINRAKLDEITSKRDRDIAEIEASGQSEIEVARQVAAKKIEYAKLEETEIRNQLRNLKENSDQRLELEIRLFKLQASIAQDRENLAKQETAAIEAQINKELELVNLNERIAKARAGDDPIEKAEAELEAVNKRLEALTRIASAEELSDSTKLKLQADIAETEAKRLDLNKQIASELANRQIAALQAQNSLQSQLIGFEKERLSAVGDYLSAENNLIGVISSGLSGIARPIEALNQAKEKALQTSQALRDIRRKEDESAEEFNRRRQQALDAEKEAQKDLAVKQREANAARRQRLILEQELANLGIRVARTDDISADIKEAQVQLQLLEIANQRELNLLKADQQRLELENLRLQQEAIAAEEKIKLSSGTLSDSEIAQSQLRLQLAQNQLRITREQAANLDRQVALTDRAFSLQQRLASTQLRNPSQSPVARQASGVAMTNTDRPTDVAKPIVEALSQIGTADQVTGAISRLETVSGAILTATQNLPNQIARVMPKPVIPR